jgi:putative hemolysin
MRVPEVRAMALPVDFAGTREAIETNLNSRTAACRLLKDGVTIIIFPSGGVATSETLLGPAEEFPWKGFVARLVQQAQASVLPVYFEGQNSRLFHFVSRYSLTIRLSLLVSEFRNFVGRTVNVYVGAPIPFAELENGKDRRQLTAELYGRVHRLAPRNIHLSHNDIHQRPPEARRRWPWDPPQVRARSAASENLASQNR